MSLLIVIPCLNEERHLPGLLAWLRADPAAADARIVVADGGSTDASAEIVRRAAEEDARVVLLENPKRLQSAGVNLAVARYGDGAECFVRVDAHAGYPPDFLSQLLDAYRESGAQSVVISMRAAGDACFQRAAAAAQNSVLGAGGSAHRKGGARRWIDHGHHALFNTEAFRAAGGYDESFSHNEDAEFDTRLTARGGKILLAADVLIDYYPRRTARALARQYYAYGAGRARTARKHAAPLKPRQLLPLAVAPALALACLTPLTLWAAAPAGAWLTLTLGYGAVLGARERNVCAIACGVPAAIMHAAWSIGFLRQALAGALRPERAAGQAPHSA